MSKLALGIIETVGLAAAFEAADVAVKSANVKLLGYELTKGNGMATIKVVGDVGAVKAAVEAGVAAAKKINTVWSKQVIPRPHDEIDILVHNVETVGLELIKQQEDLYTKEDKEESDVEKEQTNNLEEINEKVDKEEREVINGEIEKKEEREVCNLCKDPKCPRRKGELKVNCIHYEELREE